MYKSKDSVTLGSGRDKCRLKDGEESRFLEGLLQEVRMLGASTAALSNDWLRQRFKEV